MSKYLWCKRRVERNFGGERAWGVKSAGCKRHWDVGGVMGWCWCWCLFVVAVDRKSAIGCYKPSLSLTYSFSAWNLSLRLARNCWYWLYAAKISKAFWLRGPVQPGVTQGAVAKSSGPPQAKPSRSLQDVTRHWQRFYAFHEGVCGSCFHRRHLSGYGPTSSCPGYTSPNSGQGNLRHGWWTVWHVWHLWSINLTRAFHFAVHCWDHEHPLIMATLRFNQAKCHTQNPLTGGLPIAACWDSLVRGYCSNAGASSPRNCCPFNSCGKGVTNPKELFNLKCRVCVEKYLRVVRYFLSRLFQIVPQRSSTAPATATATPAAAPAGATPGSAAPATAAAAAATTPAAQAQALQASMAGGRSLRTLAESCVHSPASWKSQRLFGPGTTAVKTSVRCVASVFKIYYSR